MECDQYYAKLLSVLEELNTIKTEDGLKVVREKIEAAKKDALMHSSEYRALVEANKEKANRRNIDAHMKHRHYISDAGGIQGKYDVALAQAEAQKSFGVTANLQLSTLHCPRCGETAVNYKSTGKGKNRISLPYCFKCWIPMVGSIKMVGAKTENTWIKILDKWEVKNNDAELLGRTAKNK